MTSLLDFLPYTIKVLLQEAYTPSYEDTVDLISYFAVLSAPMHPVLMLEVREHDHTILLQDAT